MKQGFLLGVGLSFLVPSVAWAHVALVDPAPRSGDNGLTAEPCGDVAPTGNPQQYMAGETITVTWAVGTSHGGTLRIDLAEMNDMGFEEHVLAMDISDAEGMPESADVTLPDIDCDACTLRVIQVNPEEDNYVSCADVQLMGASAGSTGGDTTGGGGDSSGGGDTTAAGTEGGNQGTGPVGDDSSDGGGDDVNDDDDGTTPPGTDGGSMTAGDSTGGAEADSEDSGGCGCTTRSTAAPLWMAGLIGLAAMRRRR